GLLRRGGGGAGEVELAAQRRGSAGEARAIRLDGRELLGQALRLAGQALDRRAPRRRLGARDAELALAGLRLRALLLEAAGRRRQLLLAPLELRAHPGGLGQIRLQRRHPVGQRVAFVGERAKLFRLPALLLRELRGARPIELEL